MEQDHYVVLGVERTADPATLRAAFLRCARQCHPDRGGTDAQMKRINEAWYVLSDPDRRRRYDAVRSGRADAETQKHYREEATAAQAAAAQYPSDWDEFERWYRSVAQDFHNADYGQSWDTPEIKNSLSGWAFVKTGFVCGGIYGIYLMWGLPGLIWIRFRGVLIFAALGALLGKGLHYGLRSVLAVGSPEPGHPVASQRTASPAQPSPPPSASAEQIPRFQFACCPGCARTLRLPDPPPSNSVKCPACGYRFSLRAAR